MIYRWLFMMTSSNRNNFRVTGLCKGNPSATGGFPSQRPVTQSFDIFFDLCLNKRLSKQSMCWWFETPSRSLWRHCNVWTGCYLSLIGTKDNIDVFCNILSKMNEFSTDRYMTYVVLIWIVVRIDTMWFRINTSNLMKSIITPDSKVHGANMGPAWVQSAPGGPHVGPMNLAIRVAIYD